ncbi:MAG: type II secretion system F family protein [bacterium]|nr:type II secretion system F family protein [bacterium]
MAKFSYQARDKQTKLVDGNLEAENQTQAIDKLHALGLYPIRVQEGSAPTRLLSPKIISTKIQAPSSKFGWIKSGEVANFTRQLADLLSAGLSLMNALTVLSNQTENPKLREIVKSVRNEVQGGSTLADAMSQHPKVFNTLYISMVRAGEIGGLLETVLLRLADFSEKETEMRGKIISAMAYPLVLVVVGILAVIFLLAFIIPRFASIFEELGVALPLPTQILMMISTTMKHYWWAIFLAIGIIGVAIQRYLKSTEGKLRLNQTQLKIPVLGTIIKKKEIARFARTFGELLKNGVPILNALQISADTMTNQLVAQEIRKIRTNISEGERIAEPLKQSTVFPPMVVSMIAVGEESGHLEIVLSKIANSYEADVDRSLKVFTSLLEPAVILCMACVVGFIALAMLLPVFTINLSVGK